MVEPPGKRPSPFSPFFPKEEPSEAVKKATTYAEKKEEAKQSVQEAANGRDAQQLKEHFSPKKIALILGDTFIFKTGLEGGQIREYAENWQYLLKEIENASSFLPMDVSQEELRAIRSDMDDLLASEQAIQLKDREELMKRMKRGLETRGRFVLSGRIAGTKSDPTGHAFSLVFTKTQDGQIVCHILNKGEGSEIHPLVRIEGKEKRSYQYYPILFGKEGFLQNFLDINRENPKSGIPFFDTLVAYATQSAPDSASYTAKEVYYHLERYGTFAKELPPFRAEDAVTSQRAGTCPMQALRLTLREFFLHSTKHIEGHSHHERINKYKRLVIFEKSQTLFDFYALYQQKKEKGESLEEMDRLLPLAKNSLRAFQSSLRKGYDRDILSEEELLRCDALSELLEDLFTEREKKGEVQLLAGWDAPIRSQPQKTELEISRFYQESEKYPFSKRDPIAVQGIPTFSPKKLNQQLQSLVAPSAEKEDKALAIYSFIRHIPPPCDPFWEEIPVEEVDQVCKNLTQLPRLFEQQIHKAFSSSFDSGASLQWVLLNQLTTYGIVLRLADRSPTLRMEEFAPPPLNLRFDKRLYFHSAEDTDRWLQIQSDLKTLQKERKKRKQLGLWESKWVGEDIAYLVKGFTGLSASPKQQHLQYWSQFRKKKGEFTPDEMYKVLVSSNRKEYGSVPKLYFSIGENYWQTLHLLTHLNKLDEIGLSNIYASSHREQFQFWKDPFNTIHLDYRYPTFSLNPCEKPNFRIGTIEDPVLLELVQKDAIERDESEVMVSSYSEEGKQDKSIYHAFEKNLRYEDLTVSGLVEWCEKNPHALENPDNRHFVEALFFRDDKLIKKIQEEPTFVQHLRDMVDDYIERSRRDQNVDATLFWARLGIHIETHIWHATEEPRDRSRVDGIIKQLDLLQEKTADQFDPETKFPLWNRDIALHKTYVLSLSYPEDVDSVGKLVENFLWSQYFCKNRKTELPKWLYYEIVKQLREQKYLAHDGVKKGITDFVQSISQDDLSRANWDLSNYPLVTIQPEQGKSKYTVDLREGVIAKRGKRIYQESLPWERLFIDWEKNLVNEYASTLRKVASDTYETPDRSFKIQFSRDGEKITRKMTFGGETRLYTYQSNVKISAPPEHPLSSCVLWRSQKKEVGMLLEEDGTPRARVEIRGNTIEKIVRVDVQGKKIDPEEEVFFLDTEADEPWLTSIGKILAPKETLFWKQGEYLSAIEFSPSTDPLRLTVDRSGEAPRVFCDHLGKEYALAAEQDRTLVNDLPGSLLFLSEKPGKPRYMMLPGKQLAWRGHALVGGELETRDFLLSSETGKESYYFYEIDEKHQQLVSPSNEAMLYLIYVLLSQRDYQHAEEYIRQFQTTHFFTEREQTILDSIFTQLQTEQHPMAVALQCQLGLLLADNEQLARSQQKKPVWSMEEDPQTKEIIAFTRITKNLERYIDLAGRSEWSQIPESMRLRKGERRRLIDWLAELEVASRRLQYEKDALQQNIPAMMDNLIHYHIADVEEKWLAEYKDLEEHFPIFSLDEQQELGIRNDHLFLASSFTFFLDKILQEPERENPSIDDDLFRLFLQRKTINENSPFPMTEIADRIRFLYLVRHNTNDFLSKFGDDISRFRDDGAWTHEEGLEERRNLNKKLMSDMRRWAKEVCPKDRWREGIRTQHSQLPLSPQKAKIFQRIRKRYEEGLDPNSPAIAQRPLESFQIDFFAEPQQTPILSPGNTNFALAQEIKWKDPLAESIADSIQKAHVEKNRDKTYPSFSLQGGKTLPELSDELATAIRQTEEEMTTLRTAIEKTANPVDVLEKIEQRGGQRVVVTIHDLILQPDHPYLQDLSQVEKELLYESVLTYMQRSSFVDQVKRAKIAADKRDAQEAAEICRWERRYDPRKNPELLMYEYFSGNQLRNEPDQADILQRIFHIVFATTAEEKKAEDLRELFFEFQAGGGKTKVLSTIIALRSVHEGKHPVFFSLPDLHDVAKADLRDSLSRFFTVKLNVIELSLLDQPNSATLQAILQQIKQAHKEGKCDIVTPEAWHALHLNYQEALLAYDKERITLLTNILQHYRNNGIFLIDEAHVNLDALLKANIAFGATAGLPKSEQRLYVDAWKALLGEGRERLHKEDGTPYERDFLGILRNEQAILSKKHGKEVQQAFVRFFAEHPITVSLTPEQKEDYKTYLEDPDKEAPDWLHTLHDNPATHEQARNLALARGIIHVVMPHALGSVHIMDYGASVKETDFTDSPWENKKPMASKFESVDVTAALTIQGHFQRGLSSLEMKKMITEIAAMYRDAKTKEQRFDPEKNPLYKNFITWQKNARVPEEERITLEVLTEDWLRKDENIRWLVEKIGKTPSLVEAFITEYSLPSIESFGHKITSTAPDMAANCFAFISFSATLGRSEKYPYILSPQKQFLADAPFMADVIQRSCLPHNQNLSVLPSGSPRELFEGIFSTGGFEGLEGWINVGGWAKEISSSEAAEEFLAFSRKKKLDYQGVVYFKTSRAKGSAKEEKVLYLRKKGDRPEDDREIRLEGSDLTKELPKHGVQGEKVFKIYGPSETTGTDLFLSPSAKMALTLGEGMTASRLAQGIMRMRRFLHHIINEKQSQKILWVMPEALQEEIRREYSIEAKEIPAEVVWTWAIHNEAERQHDAILANAEQEIEFAFREELRRKLVSFTEQQKWSEQQEFLNKHREAFDQESVRDPYSLWGQGKTTRPMRELLEAFANRLAEKWKMHLEPDSSLANRIDRVIARTEKVIAEGKTAAVHCNETAQQRQRTQEQEKEKEQEKEQMRLQVSTLPPPVYPERDYAAESFALDRKALSHPEQQKNCRSLCDVYKTNLFPKNMFCLSNVYHTIRFEDPPTRFKPIDYVLVVQERQDDGTWESRAFCVSQRDAEIYQKQLLEGKGRTGRKVTLFSSGGKVVQNGKGPFGFAQGELQAILEGKDAQMETFFTRIELVNGRVRDEESIKKLYKESPSSFKELWKKIARGAIDHALLDVTTMKALVSKVNPSLMIEEEPDWVEVTPEPLPEPPPGYRQRKGVGKALKEAGWQPIGTTPAARTRSWIGHLWRTSVAYRLFSILSLGIVPLITLLIGLRRFRKLSAR